MRGEEKMGYVVATCEAMRRLLPELAQNDGEAADDYKRRLLAFFAERWKRSASTIRSWRNGNRRPDTACREFFRDLKKYGGVCYTPTGGLIRTSIDRGPTMERFLEETPSGYNADAYQAHKAGNGRSRHVPVRPPSRVRSRLRRASK